jgi:hypothetical protein
LIDQRVLIIVLYYMLLTATGLKGCSRNDPDLNACMLASANAAVSFMSKGKSKARARVHLFSPYFSSKHVD